LKVRGKPDFSDAQKVAEVIPREGVESFVTMISFISGSGMGDPERGS
jgi:hypothetical protein